MHFKFQMYAAKNLDKQCNHSTVFKLIVDEMLLYSEPPAIQCAIRSLHLPPTPYLSLSAELHSEPLCSISPSILVPITPGRRSSASTAYCLLLPSRLRSKTTDNGKCWI